MEFNKRCVNQEPRGVFRILLLLAANLSNNLIHRDRVCQKLHVLPYCKAENGLPFMAAFSMHSTQTLCGNNGNG